MPIAGKPALYTAAGIDCQKVCQEYETCEDSSGVQAGFTCDATLCTGHCNDRDLVSQACAGLTSDAGGVCVANC
jgi:hypothetical protein